MRSFLPILLLVMACGPATQPDNQQPATDNALVWSLIDAQDHRDTKKLVELLGDTSTVIRARAALAS